MHASGRNTFKMQDDSVFGYLQMRSNFAVPLLRCARRLRRGKLRVIYLVEAGPI